jgi:cytidine deaminase
MNEDLLDAAREVRENSYCPYSGIAVGAALRTRSGRIFTGCNVENSSFPNGVCAEVAAVAAAVAAGEREFSEIVIVGGQDRPMPPCGSCRQVLWEFSPDLRVVMVAESGSQREAGLRDLLPEGFRLGDGE